MSQQRTAIVQTNRGVFIYEQTSSLSAFIDYLNTKHLYDIIEKIKIFIRTPEGTLRMPVVSS